MEKNYGECVAQRCIFLEFTRGEREGRKEGRTLRSLFLRPTSIYRKRKEREVRQRLFGCMLKVL